MFGVITKTALATTLAAAAYFALMQSSMAGPDAATYVSVGAGTRKMRSCRARVA